MIYGQVEHLNGATPSNEVGVPVTEGSTSAGDVLVIGEDLGFIFKFIRVDVAGDLAIRGKEGNTIFLTNVVPGEWYPLVGSGIVAGTTATGVRWYGGA